MGRSASTAFLQYWGAGASERRRARAAPSFGSYRAQRLVRGRREGPFVSSLSHAPTATPTRKVQRYVRTTNMFMEHSGPAKTAAIPSFVWPDPWPSIGVGLGSTPGRRDADRV